MKTLIFAWYMIAPAVQGGAFAVAVVGPFRLFFLLKERRFDLAVTAGLVTLICAAIAAALFVAERRAR